MTIIEELQRRIDLKKAVIVFTEAQIAELEAKIEEEREGVCT